MSEFHIGDTEFEMLEHPYGEFQTLPEQLNLKFRTIWVKRHRYENNHHKNGSERARRKDEIQG